MTTKFIRTDFETGFEIMGDFTCINIGIIETIKLQEVLTSEFEVSFIAMSVEETLQTIRVISA